MVSAAGVGMMSSVTVTDLAEAVRELEAEQVCTNQIHVLLRKLLPFRWNILRSVPSVYGVHADGPCAKLGRRGLSD